MSFQISEERRAELVAAGLELGMTSAQINNAIDRVLAAATEAKVDQDAANVAKFTAKVDAFEVYRDRVLQGRAWSVSNAPDGVVKTATLDALDEAIALIDDRLARLQRKLAELA